MGKYIIALDQGTTSSRSIAYDESARPLAQHSQEYRQIYPRPGWVEHDPEEIWSSQIESLRELMRSQSIAGGDIAALGITNQRETVLIWDKRTGIPVYNAIVWQCRRTAEYCEKLLQEGHETLIRERTGLLPDAYFSATKIQWMLNNVEGLRERAQRGEVLAGTVDTWLIWRMTGGRVHVTDCTNAGRTMLFNIHRACWDEELLALFDIPACILPEVRDTSCVYGYTDPDIMGFSAPIASAVGDQHAALFGQACFAPGCVKNTYGTGCFTLMNTGDMPVAAKGLLTTIAWSMGGKITYALEGSIFIGGAVIQWLRDELGLISSADEVNYWASQVKDSEGVYIVPAFVGLGTPHWDMYARGTIVGLTRGSNKSHICRAALDSIAYQVRDVVHLMRKSAGTDIPSLRVDGGASVSEPLMQFQADILNLPVQRPENIQTTALGAAYLAGLATGFWGSTDEIESIWQCEETFRPAMDEQQRKTCLRGWNRAVERAKGWAE